MKPIYCKQTAQGIFNIDLEKISITQNGITSRIKRSSIGDVMVAII